jgi:Atypical PilZ domain, cyclic di-GMP receptor
MPESFLGDGLIFEDSLPLVFTPGPLPTDVALARLNADNHQLLGAEASLDEVRVHEALKDESPALLHELQRLEFKLNVLLRLTADLARRSSTGPPPRRIRLSAVGLELPDENSCEMGGTGMLDLYINSTLPQPLKLPVVVVGNRAQADGMPAAQMQFSGLSEQVVYLIEKLIFRRHRRLVAGSRGPVAARP